jgi:dynein heavy chain
MTVDIEDVINSIYDNKVSKKWLSMSYPSLKPLGSYLIDLIKRIDFIKNWIDN